MYLKWKFRKMKDINDEENFDLIKTKMLYY